MASFDLKLDDDQEIFPDLVTGEIGIQSAPVVAGNTIINRRRFPRRYDAGAAMRNNKGYVRGFDVRTGSVFGFFNTIPKKGEFGYDTWEKTRRNTPATRACGRRSQWTNNSASPIAVESPTSDFYGGPSAGNNLFANAGLRGPQNPANASGISSLSTIRCGHDISSGAILADITVDGKPSKPSHNRASKDFFTFSIASRENRCGPFGKAR